MSVAEPLYSVLGESFVAVTVVAFLNFPFVEGEACLPSPRLCRGVSSSLSTLQRVIVNNFDRKSSAKHALLSSNNKILACQEMAHCNESNSSSQVPANKSRFCHLYNIIY